MFRTLSNLDYTGYMVRYRSASDAGLLNPDVLDNLLARYLYQGEDIVASGTYPDASTRGRDATLIGDAHVDEQGLHLDGSGDYGNCGNIVLNTPATFVGSITPNDVSSVTVIVASDSGTYSCRGITLSSGKLYYRWSSGSGIIHVYQSDDVVASVGVKVSLAVSHDASTDIPVLYADGQPLAATKISEAGSLNYPTASIQMCLGKFGANNGGYFNGILHEVRLYGVARTAEEVYSIHRNLR